MVTHHVTKDFIVRQIEKLSQDGLIEVAQFIEFLQFREPGPIQAAGSGAHSAFGVWADYPEAKALLLYRGKEKLKMGKIFCCPVDEFLKQLTPNRWIEI